MADNEKRKSTPNYTRQQWERNISNEMMGNLSHATGFSMDELWKYLESFSQAARLGRMNEENFRSVFTRFVPEGSEMAATAAFRAIDTDNDGYINFQDFIYALRMSADDDILDRMTWALRLLEETGVYNLPFSKATSLLKDVVRLTKNPQLERSAVDDAKDILYAADKSGGHVDVPNLANIFRGAATLYQQGSISSTGDLKKTPSSRPESSPWQQDSDNLEA